MGLETVDVEIRNITSVGGIVHTERVDHLRRADGRLIVSAPVAGILEWHEGRIVTWREYFDSASFVGRALPRLAVGAAQRASVLVRRVAQGSPRQPRTERRGCSGLRG